MGSNSSKVRVPEYTRHSSGQARVRIDGKAYYLGPYNSTASRAKYNRRIGEYTAVVMFGVQTARRVRDGARVIIARRTRTAEL